MELVGLLGQSMATGHSEAKGTQAPENSVTGHLVAGHLFAGALWGIFVLKFGDGFVKLRVIFV